MTEPTVSGPDRLGIEVVAQRLQAAGNTHTGASRIESSIAVLIRAAAPLANRVNLSMPVHRSNRRLLKGIIGMSLSGFVWDLLSAIF